MSGRRATPKQKPSNPKANKIKSNSPPAAPPDATAPPGGESGEPEPRRGVAGDTRTPEQIARDQRRIEELRQIEEQARAERQKLEGLNAAQAPPARDFGEFQKRKGFRYASWFKAFGTFGDLRDLGDSPPLLGEMEELEDFDVPAAFYSSAILGKVRWIGIVAREDLLKLLNQTLFPEDGFDFRDVYPSWQYRYFVAEMVGDIVVQIFEYQAKQPLTKKDRVRGFRGR